MSQTYSIFVFICSSVKHLIHNKCIYLNVLLLNRALVLCLHIRLQPGLEISAGHRSLAGKISQFDRQISSISIGKYRRLADMRDQ